MLQLENIDTSEQAKTFAKMIEGNPKTYFLQGNWGSGKTEYLNNVKEYLDGFKFIELKLWEPKDKTSLAKKLFSATLVMMQKP